MTFDDWYRSSATKLQLIEEMRELLTEYMTQFPAFRAKPEGSPYSEARKEQEADIAREDRVRAVLALRPGFELNPEVKPERPAARAGERKTARQYADQNRCRR